MGLAWGSGGLALRTLEAGHKTVRPLRPTRAGSHERCFDPAAPLVQPGATTGGMQNAHPRGEAPLAPVLIADRLTLHKALVRCRLNRLTQRRPGLRWTLLVAASDAEGALAGSVRVCGICLTSPPGPSRRAI